MEYTIDTDRIFYPGKKEVLPLIHITSDFDILKSIIKDGFKPSYCTEIITNDIESKSACFPMISFSNVSVEYAINKQRSYGTLGVVLDKNWGEENDLNPVLYLERKSDLTNEIVRGFTDIRTYSKKDLDDALQGQRTNHKSLLTKHIIKVFAHSKNYDGNLIRGGILFSEKYPYGLEREWRKITREDKIPYFLIGDEIENKSVYNEKLKSIRYDFPLKYLKGLIVESEWEEKEIKKVIMTKYNLSEFPSNIKIRINSIRHIPDEG